MAINTEMTDRPRQKLGHLPNRKEKKMFRGIFFLIEDKIVASAGNDEFFLYR